MSDRGTCTPRSTARRHGHDGRAHRHRRALRSFSLASSSTTPGAADFEHYGIPAPELASSSSARSSSLRRTAVVGLLTRPAQRCVAATWSAPSPPPDGSTAAPSTSGSAPRCSSRCCSSCGPAPGTLALDSHAGYLRRCTCASAHEVAGDRLPQLGRQRERLLVDALVVAVEHRGVVVVGEPLSRTGRTRSRPRRRAGRSGCRCRPPSATAPAPTPRTGRRS